MTDNVPDVTITTIRRSLWERASVVWLVPLAALAIALGVAWQSWADRGPLIEIAFANASGVAAGETALRYRNVTVGMVEDVSFSPTLDNVIVTVRLDKDVAPFVDADAQFWVVSPEVTTQGISGLDTVLSGVFIEGLWDGVPGTAQSEFAGQTAAPLLAAGQEGLRIRLRSTDGSLTSVMPILYKGVQVGQVGPAEVQPGGLAVVADAVIFAPHDQLVSQSTRFWDTSGFSLSIGTSGAAVNFDSIASLLAGGITFDTFISDDTTVEEGYQFEVFADGATARTSVFNRPDGPALDLIAVFEGSATGLTEGAAVEIDGLRIGEVTSINGLLDPDLFGDSRVRLQAVLQIRPARLGLEGDDSPEEALEYLTGQVAQGMRAQLATGNLLTGGLKVQLVIVPDAPEARLNMNYQPFPLIPSTASLISDVAANAQGTLARINALPIEELFAQVIAVLDNANRLIASDELQATPEELRGLLADLRGVVGDEAIRALPGQLGSFMAELEMITGDLRAILAEVEGQEAVARVLATVDSLDALVIEARGAIAGMPGLIDSADGLIESADGLIGPEAALPAELTGAMIDLRAVLADVQGLTGDAATQALPAQVAGLVAQADESLTRVNAALATLEEAQAVARIVAAVEAFEGAAVGAEAAVSGVPDLVADLGALADTAASLPLDELVTGATALMEEARALVGSDDVVALPGDLSAALDDLGAVLRDLRTGGVIENANATLAAAATASEGIASATQSLPALIARADGVLAQATATLAGLDASSGLVRDAQAAIREVTRAADAIAQLARTIERNPNSLIFGR